MPRGRTKKVLLMEKKRFSKALVREVLYKLACQIEADQRFNRHDGTAQLAQRGAEPEWLVIARSVEYGRMRAFRQFAEAIEDGLA